MKNNLPLLRKRSSQVTSGLCYIGNLYTNFHIIVRCPVHVYVVLRKVFDEAGIPTKFFGGNIPVSDVVLPQFLGTFIYKFNGKTKKFNAAMVYPLDMSEVTLENINFVNKLLNVFRNTGFQYYDKKDRTAKTIFCTFASDFIADYEFLMESFESAL